MKTSLHRRIALLLVTLFPATALIAQQPHIPGVDPIGIDASIQKMQDATSNVRAGRKMMPREWPNHAHVAVCISFDVDNEALWRQTPIPVPLSEGEYGATEGLPRILALLDREAIPASFYVPVLSAALHPQMIAEIRKRARHEIGVHGWVHEAPSTIGDPVQPWSRSQPTSKKSINGALTRYRSAARHVLSAFQMFVKPFNSRAS
jgi:hypothetical protein